MGKERKHGTKKQGTVLINESYKFEIDPFNINLWKKQDASEKDDSDEKEGDWVCKGHFGNLEAALTAVLTNMARYKLYEKEKVSLEEFKNIYLRCLQEIKDIAKITSAEELLKEFLK